MLFANQVNLVSLFTINSPSVKTAKEISTLNAQECIQEERLLLGSQESIISINNVFVSQNLI